MLVNRRGEQLFDIRQGQVYVAVSKLTRDGDGEPDESVAMAVLAFAGLEEPGQIAGALRIGCGSEFFLEVGEPHNGGAGFSLLRGLQSPIFQND